MQNFRIRTQVILGELIADGQRKGTIKSQDDGINQYSGCNTPEHPQTLEELGITRKQSSDWQHMATIPKDTLEEFIEEKKQKVNDGAAELTPRLARTE